MEWRFWPADYGRPFLAELRTAEKKLGFTGFFPLVNFSTVELKQIISEQIKNHAQINLLYQEGALQFAFGDALQWLLKKLAAGDLPAPKTEELLRHACEAALSTFYRVNQYYQFDDKAVEALYRIYEMLIDEVRECSVTDFRQLARKHFLRLQEWLQTHEPETSILFAADKQSVSSKVVCAEYPAVTQCRTLNLDISKLALPVLDIGCGRGHALVNYLKETGLPAFGIDREAEPGKFVQRIGWLDYDYGEKRWGTVVSHLAFSNHFRHQHYRKNSDHARYATVYMQILHSLKPGGTFFYAPDLPFIEAFLNSKEYTLVRFPIPQTGFCSASVTRLPN